MIGGYKKTENDVNDVVMWQEKRFKSVRILRKKRNWGFEGNGGFGGYKSTENDVNDVVVVSEEKRFKRFKSVRILRK